jgi:predicted RNA-binding protein with EMAP domain
MAPDVIEPDDPRLRVAEAALETTASVFEHRHLQRQDIAHGECLQRCQDGLSSLQEARYTYAAPDDLRALDAFQRVVDVAAELRKALGGEAWHESVPGTEQGIARVRWGTNVLATLPERLDLPGTGLEVGIDARVGSVVTARDHPEADLQLLRVAAGRGFDVVTNDLAVAADDRVGLALLPPSEVGGRLSEAMLLGVPGEGVLAGVEAGDDGRPDVPDEAWSETRNALDRSLD